MHLGLGIGKGFYVTLDSKSNSNRLIKSLMVSEVQYSTLIRFSRALLPTIKSQNAQYITFNYSPKY